MDTLVTAEWLKQHINDSGLVILDCTVVTMPDVNDARGLHNVSGRPDYELGHIPNAGFADLKDELCKSTRKTRVREQLMLIFMYAYIRSNCSLNRFF